jgi:hypothetical protein
LDVDIDETSETHESSGKAVEKSESSDNQCAGEGSEDAQALLEDIRRIGFPTSLSELDKFGRAL